MTQEKILLAHGGGGWLTNELINDLVINKLGNPILNHLQDSALINVPSDQIAFTTDSYVVKPLFFKGGDIGRLAVCGTVNDLAMSAAMPIFISLSLIIEEGFLMRDLTAIIDSIKIATKDANVRVVCGDTKVVERGAANGIFINTSGIGVRADTPPPSPSNICPGDVILINGFIGDHGIAVISSREGIEFESPITSDVAPLWGLVSKVLNAGIEIHCMRDPTRGGVAAALNEIAANSRVKLELYEDSLPIRSEVHWACNMLGLDPLVIANEGKVIMFCPETSAETAIEIMQSTPYGQNARIIGRVVDYLPNASTTEEANLTPEGGRSSITRVILKTTVGGVRIVEMPYGEVLPRIC